MNNKPFALSTYTRGAFLSQHGPPDLRLTGPKARFDALRADPAYKAAENDSVAPDQFVRKFITGPSATRDAVTRMRENLKDNDTATSERRLLTQKRGRPMLRPVPGGAACFCCGDATASAMIE